MLLGLFTLTYIVQHLMLKGSEKNYIAQIWILYESFIDVDMNLDKNMFENIL